MLTAIAVLGGAVMFAAILGDATIGAFISGFFSMATMFISVHLTRQNRRLDERGQRIEDQGKHLKKVLEAPRQMVFDSDGRPVGTILRLAEEEDVQQVQVLRRHTDPDLNDLA